MMINPLKGMAIHIVEAGTVVGKDRDGNDMTVTDTNTIYDRSKVWMTRNTYEALKAKIGPTP